jgi:hypothetical protein
MPNRYLEIAKKQEEVAKKLKETRKKTSQNKQVIAEAYEDAGNAFLNAGYSEEAKENYMHALNYTTTKSEKQRLEGKLEKLHASYNKKKNIFELLESGLEKKVAGFMAVGTLILSFFFATSNLTGFAISNFSSDNSRFIGLCFFVCGLLFAFVFLKKK